MTALIAWFAATAALAGNTLYDQAIQALAAGNLPQYRAVLAQLGNSPLTPFLEYRRIKGAFDNEPANARRAFIEHYPAAVVSDALRRRWLRELGKQGNWQPFLALYHGDTDAELRCYAIQARLATDGYTDTLDAAVESLWLTGSRRPQACESVFEASQRAGRMDAARVWQRIALAIGRGHTQLAADLGQRLLPPAEQVWLDRWQAMIRDPDRALATFDYPPSDPHAGEILRGGLRRLAARNAALALKRWQAVRKRLALDDAWRRNVMAIIGVAAALNHDPIAGTLLARTELATADQRLRAWRIRDALRNTRWRDVVRYIDAMPTDEQAIPRWRYWKARALQALGNPAWQSVAHQLATLRNYYGFLAADRVGLAYQMQAQPLTVVKQVVDTLRHKPGIRMASALYAVGADGLARRQWNWALRDASAEQLRAAALLAGRNGWYDRAIYTVTRAGAHNALKLRFPVTHLNVVRTNARRNGLNPSWIYGVIRQESAFIPNARSPAGALGLMQLMPSTARHVSRKLRLRLASHAAILNPDNNIRLGTTYLRTMLDGLAGNPVLATAAYNAGRRRVLSWLPDKGRLSADIWVETIPFTETRNYVKNILAFTVVYDYRRGKPIKRLADRMPDVTADAGVQLTRSN